MSHFNPKSYEPSPNSRCAFIGLGVMGFPMAAHLAQAGHSVSVYNRTASKAQDWVEVMLAQGAPQDQLRAAATPAEAASGADFVFVCVGNDSDLRQVVPGPTGALAGMGPDTVLVDHTTASADVARELAQAAAKQNIAFIDAPVSGGQAGAQNGALTVMCGGDEAAFARVQPIAMAYSRAFTLMGPSGSGQLTKMVNQICVAGLIEALAEGIHFGQSAGLDMHKVMTLLGNGAASSWQMLNRHQSMLAGEYNHGFAVDHMHKDLGICLKQAEKLKIELPVTRQVTDFYHEIQQDNGGRRDTSALLLRLQKQHK